MFYFLILISAVILIALYQFFPRKKIFVYFCILLAVIFLGSAFIQNRRAEEEKISREQIELMQMQEQIFINWYAAYQKDVDALDRNWQSYYDWVESLKTSEIYEEVDYEQILELEKEVVAEQIKIHNLQIPQELEEDCKIILSEVVSKTQNYSDAQAKVVTEAKEISDPKKVKNLAELNKKIKDITIREVPAGLFTASEISQIREKLKIPEEVGGKN